MGEFQGLGVEGPRVEGLGLMICVWGLCHELGGLRDCLEIFLRKVRMRGRKEWKENGTYHTIGDAVFTLFKACMGSEGTEKTLETTVPECVAEGFPF